MEWEQVFRALFYRTDIPQGGEFLWGIKFHRFRGSYFIWEKNSILGYICTHDLKYTGVCICKISCMCMGDDDHLDHILGGSMYNELVAMMESSPQQPSFLQNLLGVIQATMNDSGSKGELPTHKGRRGELQGGGSCQGPCQ